MTNRASMFIERSRNIVVALCCLAPLLTGNPVTADDDIYTIRKSAIGVSETSFQAFPNEVLIAAMEATRDRFGDYKVIEIPRPPTKLRKYNHFDTGISNVMTSPHLDRMYERGIRVNFPLLRGLAGFRIALIKAGDQHRFHEINDLSGLSQIAMGQGLGWQDGLILEHNGIPVVRSINTPNLYGMLALGRFDAFPRGVNVIKTDFDKFSKSISGVAIEENLLIHYRFPIFFFVNKEWPELAERLTVGMTLIKSNGTYDQLFDDFFGTMLKDLNLSNRTLIQLENPFLPDDVPSFDDPIWYDPKYPNQ